MDQCTRAMILSNEKKFLSRKDEVFCQQPDVGVFPSAVFKVRERKREGDREREKEKEKN